MYSAESQLQKLQNNEINVNENGKNNNIPNAQCLNETKNQTANFDTLDLIYLNDGLVREILK